MKPFQEMVKKAFLKTHRGHSPDDVVIDDELNAAFIAACHEEMPSVSMFDLNWTLLNLRKSSNLGPVATQKRTSKHEDYVHAAQIAARLMEDKHGLTIDRVLCYPNYRIEFDSVARKIAPDVSPYLLRKAALTLRKTRRLTPELVKRIADWGKEVLTYPASELEKDPDMIPRLPGVYIFRDDSGYLYIGEADNLRKRLSKHLDHSDRKAIARYLWEKGMTKLTVELHVFSADSEGRIKSNRRAYESDLIKSRKPKFNIQV